MDKKIICLFMFLVLISSTSAVIQGGADWLLWDFNSGNNDTVGYNITENEENADNIKIIDNKLQVLAEGAPDVWTALTGVIDTKAYSQVSFHYHQATNNAWVMYLQNDGGSIIQLNPSGGLCTAGGIDLANCTSGVDYNVTLILDWVADTFDFYLNGVLEYEGAAFLQAGTGATNWLSYQNDAGTILHDWVLFGTQPPGAAPPVTSSLNHTLNHSSPVNENETTNLNLSLTWSEYNITDSNADIIYNGTVYAATPTSVNYAFNGSANYTVNINTPFTKINDSDIQFFWNYTITNFTEVKGFNSSLQNQSLLWKYPRLNITRVYNSYSNNTISNFSGNISKNGFITTFNTTTGDSLIILNNGTGNYTVYVESLGYAVNNETNFQNLEVTSTDLNTYNMTFGLYSNNSILMYIRSENTGELITDVITIVVSGDATENSYNTSTGVYFVGNLTDGEYTVKFNGDQWKLQTYTVTVADRSTQTLNAYLSNANGTTTFNFIDDELGSSVEGVAFSASRIINGSWAVILSKESDITGRVQFTYTEDVHYRFYASKEGFTSKTFDLDPVIFTSYSVRLDRIAVSNESSDYSDVNIYFTPKTFYNGAKNNLTFYFNSPSGLFETYGFNISYPTGIVTFNGTNANGENFAVNFTITDANLTDRVNITFWYDSTLDNIRKYHASYSIIGSAGIFGTSMDNKNNPYGLTLFDRVFIVTVILLILSGFAFYFAGMIPAGMIAILLLGYFMKISFISPWFGFPSIIILILVTAWRGSL